MRAVCRFAFLPALILMLGIVLRPQYRAEAASFDGIWSVIVITEEGNCDRAYRYPVRVVNGQIRYEGEAGINVSGRVDGSGRLNATISRGEHSASGTGRLTQRAGSGTWSGKSKTSACSGRWQAERRDD
jgi:hypothetical protein